MNANITEVIAAVAHLDNLLSRLGGCDDGVVAITIDPQAFQRLLEHHPRATHAGNRFEIAGVVIRKGVPTGRGDGDQPEIRRATNGR